MIDVDSFTEDQKTLLSLVVSDFGGPTSTVTMLSIIDRLLEKLSPDHDLQIFSDDPELKSDIEVCLVAIQHWKVTDLSK